MSQEAELFDGTVLEFPDETPPDVIHQTAKRITLQKQSAAGNAPEEPASMTKLAAPSIGESVMRGVKNIPSALIGAAKTVGQAAVTPPEDSSYMPDLSRFKDVFQGLASGATAGLYQPEPAQSEAQAARRTLGNVAGYALPFGAASKAVQAARVPKFLADLIAGGVTSAAQPLSQGDIPQAIEQGTTGAGAVGVTAPVAGLPARVISGTGKTIQSLINQQAAKGLGGASEILKGATENLAGPASIEQAGAAVQAGARSAGKAMREQAGGAIQQAISSIPENEVITSSASNQIRDLLPEAGPLKRGAELKLEKLAADLAAPANNLETMQISRGANAMTGAELRAVNPRYFEAISRALGKDATATTQGADVTLSELESRRRALGLLSREATNDADARLYRLAQNAVDSDINQFADKYPQAISDLKAGRQQYKETVVPYYSKGAPLRDLVDKTNPSTTIANLGKMDIEDIKSSVKGLQQGPDGPQTLEAVKGGVVRHLVETSIDPESGAFDVPKFIKNIGGPTNSRKLSALLGDKYDDLQNFKQQLIDSGATGFKTGHGAGSIKYMGAYHLLRGGEQLAIGSPFAFYHLASAATMFLAPGLFAKMLENRVGANLLAQGMTTTPGSQAAAMISSRLTALARALGGQEVTAAQAAALTQTGGDKQQQPNILGLRQTAPLSLDQLGIPSRGAPTGLQGGATR